MKNSIKKQKGVGLIEVLVTTVVVAIGLLAIASLQGNLIGESGENKARAEAKSLCETKLEQLRDTAVRGLDGSVLANEYSGIGMSGSALVTTDAAGLRTGVTTEPTINGTNEVFTRVTTVIESADPVRKQIDVTCSWGDGGADEQIIVQTVLRYDSLVGAVSLSKPESASVLSPSTNADSSDNIYDDTKVDLTTLTQDTDGLYIGGNLESDQVVKDNGDGTGRIVYRCEPDVDAINVARGDNRLVAFDPFYPEFNPTVSPASIGINLTITEPIVTGTSDGEGRPLRIDDSTDANDDGRIDRIYYRRVHFTGNDGFNEAIEIFEPNDMVTTITTSGPTTTTTTTYGNTCTRVIRYNGGVMVPITGKVYSKVATKGGLVALGELELFTFSATESGSYCYPKVFDESSFEDHYVCYIGGNCIDNIGDENANPDFITECPLTFTETSPSVAVYEKGITVGPGGWRGKIGLLGIAPEGLNTCFEEEFSDTFPDATNPLHTLDTARNYFTRVNRTGAGDGHAANEGLNKGYLCQDFLIIAGQANKAKVGATCSDAEGVIQAFNKESKEVKRVIGTEGVLTTDSNIFISSADTGACTVNAALEEKSFDVTITNPPNLNKLVFTTPGVDCSNAADSTTAGGTLLTGCTILTKGTSLTVTAEDNTSGANGKGECFIADLASSPSCTLTLFPHVILEGTVVEGTNFGAELFDPVSLISFDPANSCDIVLQKTGNVQEHHFSCPDVKKDTVITITPNAGYTVSINTSDSVNSTTTLTNSPTTLKAGIEDDDTLTITINKQ